MADGTLTTITSSSILARSMNLPEDLEYFRFVSSHLGLPIIHTGNVAESMLNDF